MTAEEQEEAVFLLQLAADALRKQAGKGAESCLAMNIDEFLEKVDDTDPLA
jgi:hypothetical protein